MRTKNLLLALTMICLPCLGTLAQEKPPEKKGFSVRSYGDGVQPALEEAAKALGLALDLKLEDTDATVPCWFSLESEDRATIVAGLRIATGLRLGLSADGKKLTVVASDPAGEFVKGYDVSVISSRYRQYVNRYGKRVDTRAGASLITPTERLAELISRDASSLDEGNNALVFAVGQRMLVRGDSDVHSRVRAWLRLLGSEADTMSDAARGATLCNGRLNAGIKLDAYDNRPLGSVVASICRLARLPFVVEASLAREFSEQHLSRAEEAGGLPMEFLQELAVAQKFSVGYDSCGIRVSRRARGPQIGAWWMVDCTKLLERLAQEFRNEATEAGREGGFDGDLVAKGGVAVITGALAKAQDGFTVQCHGARLLIYSTPDGFARAQAILKELGWEAPAND